MHASIKDHVSFEVRREDEQWRFPAPPHLSDALSHLEGQIDLIVAGPPCQGHSNLNNVTRRDDARNQLYVVAVAMAVAMRPHAIVIENVPEVRASVSRVVDVSRSLLESSGYTTSEFSLTARDLGWPQTRRRHFLLASRTGIASAQDLTRAFGGKHPNAIDFLKRLPPRPRPAIINAVPDFRDETRRRLSYFERNDEKYDLPLELRPECHRDGTTYEAAYGRIPPHGPFPTITRGFLTPGRGRFVHPTEPRTLTPSEAAYVQGFPAWYEFGKDGEVNKTMLTKWIGDAVPLPLGYVAAMAALPGMLGKTIEEVVGG